MSLRIVDCCFNCDYFSLDGFLGSKGWCNMKQEEVSPDSICDEYLS